MCLNRVLLVDNVQLDRVMRTIICSHMVTVLLWILLLCKISIRPVKIQTLLRDFISVSSAPNLPSLLSRVLIDFRPGNTVGRN